MTMCVTGRLAAPTESGRWPMGPWCRQARAPVWRRRLGHTSQTQECLLAMPKRVQEALVFARQFRVQGGHAVTPRHPP